MGAIPKTFEYFYSTCHYGAEAALKSEILSRYKDVTVGFSKKGFVTFKSKKPLNTDFQLQSVFSEAWGFSIKALKETGPECSDWLDFAESLCDEDAQLQIWGRNRKQNAADEELNQVVEKARARVKSKGVNLTRSIDVIWIEETECFIGIYFEARSAPLKRLGIGNQPVIELPKEAPSRAYLKINEAFQRFRPPIEVSARIMEVGSAPGGASFFLLKKGFQVIGVDSAKMADVCIQNENFKHLKKSMAQLTPSDVPSHIEWVALDINVKAADALSLFRKLLHKLPDIKGALLTLKIHHTNTYTDVSSYLEKIRAMGFSEVSAKQLYHNRQELFVYALAAKNKQPKQNANAAGNAKHPK